MTGTRRQVCSVPVDALSMDETLQLCAGLVESGASHQHVVVNAAKIVAAHDDPELLRVIAGCSVISADGQSVVWASRVLRRPLPERVAGIDLMYRLWDLAAERRWPVYLLGARAEVVESVAQTVSGHGIAVAGYRHGFWREEEEPEVVRAVRDSHARLLFIAMPSPRKELFLAQWLPEMGVGLAMGVGGSFDIVAGVTKRAPAWLQRAGLEWLFRLGQEPRRMFRRYLVGNARFIHIVLKHLVRTGA